MTTAATELNHWSDCFQPVDPEEAETIIAGESLLYWVAYGVGSFVHMIANSSGTQSSGQKLMNVAL